MKKRNLAESHITGDVVEIKDNDGKELLYLDYEQEKYNPIPFLYDGDHLVIGKCAEGHVDLLDAEGCTHPTDFGRFFCNKYVVDWAYLGPSFASRNFYAKLQKDAMKWYNLDLSDYIILFKDKYMNFFTDGSSVFNDSPAYAVVLKDYVRGKEPVEYSEFINAQSNPPKRMNKFDKFRGESDTDVEARENYRLWHYGSIAENKNNKNMKKNVIKLNENALRQIVAESVKKVLREYHPDKVMRDTQIELYRKKQAEQDEKEISNCMSELKPIFDDIEGKYGDLAYAAIMRLAKEMNPNQEAGDNNLNREIEMMPDDFNPPLPRRR